MRSTHTYTHLYAPCSMPHTPCPMPHAPCSMPYAPCSMPHALWPMPHAPCPMPHVPCPIPHALYALYVHHTQCPMPHAHGSWFIPHPPCPIIYIPVAVLVQSGYLFSPPRCAPPASSLSARRALRRRPSSPQLSTGCGTHVSASFSCRCLPRCLSGLGVENCQGSAWCLG